MSPALFGAFVGATAILMLIPGPNVALIVANSLTYGPRAGLVTVAGTSAAMVVQLAVAALGVTALLGALAQAFEILRWIGVAYLVWLGVRAWRAPADDLVENAPDLPGQDLRPRLSRLADEPQDARLLRGLPAPVPRSLGAPRPGRWRSSA